MPRSAIEAKAGTFASLKAGSESNLPDCHYSNPKLVPLTEAALGKSPGTS
jgi:hypothetical protein